jgi:hypothetical protein
MENKLSTGTLDALGVRKTRASKLRWGFARIIKQETKKIPGLCALIPVLLACIVETTN